MFPCQDTPAIKASYCSTVRSSLPVLMSGLRVSPPPEQTPAPGTMTEYSYRQPCAIPSYLIAIASGELVYRPFDGLFGKEWKTGCWAEVRWILLALTFVGTDHDSPTRLKRLIGSSRKILPSRSASVLGCGKLIIQLCRCCRKVRLELQVRSI
jgi:hypothetical protein